MDADTAIQFPISDEQREQFVRDGYIGMPGLIAPDVVSSTRTHTQVGLNTAVMPDPKRPYQRKDGSPQAGWTPLG